MPHMLWPAGLAGITGFCGREGDQTTGGIALEGMWALSVSFMTGTDLQDLGHGEKGVSLSSIVWRDSCLEAYPVYFPQGHTLGLTTSDGSCSVFTTHSLETGGSPFCGVRQDGWDRVRQCPSDTASISQSEK